MGASWINQIDTNHQKEGARTVTPRHGVADACRFMAKHKIHHLIVVDEDQVIGVVSHKDILEKGFTCGLPQINPILRVEEVMRVDFPILTPTSTYEDALRAMVDFDIDMAAIMQGDDLIGVVTDSDLLRFTDHWLRNSKLGPTRLKAETMELASHPIAQSVMTIANDIGL